MKNVFGLTFSNIWKYLHSLPQNQGHRNKDHWLKVTWALRSKRACKRSDKIWNEIKEHKINKKLIEAHLDNITFKNIFFNIFVYFGSNFR